MGTVSTLGARRHEVTGVSSEEELEAERAAEEKATREALDKYWKVRPGGGGAVDGGRTQDFLGGRID